MGMGMDRTRQTHGHMDKDMDGWTVTDIQDTTDRPQTYRRVT